ncbi:hypothetical protein PFICI_05571 [Pestalotiopsis fici W106-1]|uniref:Uncharacterized protein n=1 Tax=Pestalotiopsis fici (strain W106-1 / CGMCC3.15140) TaxID=1229662 RepID=W3XCB6_PESFW|nr:uncharacterized protein PFICI_05571 [Pestalotiopsis fici W106-1]ETS83695.1 hypothetical protein PFICI_05571 [Pestalotiopsis fici W106-1]
MAPVSLALKLAVALLMIISIIELSFVSATVGWLHRTASKGFHFIYDGSTYPLAGMPQNFLTDQGHTSNGAAGTAFVLIGLGGIISLWIRSRTPYQKRSFAIYIYYLWIALQIPALLLTVGALGYVFNVTNAREGQTINQPLAANLDGSKYPEGSWTPQNWFAAVSHLDLVSGRGDLLSHLHVMRGWQYNLIPFFLIQLAETVLAFLDFSKWHRNGGKMTGHSEV